MTGPDPTPDQGSSLPDDPSPASDEAFGRPTEEEVEDAIARGLLEIHETSYGRGAGSARSHFEGDTLVVILDNLELQPHEALLIAKGRKDIVLDVRSNFQLAIKDTFRAAVERATGRKVIAFLSTTHIDEPRFSVEIFRLAPAPAG